MTPTVLHGAFCAPSSPTETCAELTLEHTVMTMDSVRTLISEETLTRLDALRASAPVNLVLVETPLAGLGVEVAKELATGWVGEESRDLDVKVVAPSSDRWSVAEVHELLVNPTTIMPSERNFIVVDQAASMQRSAAEHLLKTVEEPLTPTTFVFCTPSADALITTLEGRAGARLLVQAASTSVRVDALVASGVDREMAVRAVRAAGDQAFLAPVIAVDPALLEAAELLFDDELTTSTPARDAEARASAALSLGTAVARSAGRSGDSLARANARLLVRELLNRRRIQVMVQLARNPDNAAYARLLEHLRRADEAETQMVFYASLNLVLAAAVGG